MLTKDLITGIAKETKLTKGHTEELLKHMLKILPEQLIQGKSIQLQGLGSFSIKERKARKIIHPQTGKEGIVSARRQLVFKPTSGIKQALRKA